MDQPLSANATYAPQAPGRTPRSASRRAFGSTQLQAPQYWPARLRHAALTGQRASGTTCPGAEDKPFALL